MPPREEDVPVRRYHHGDLRPALLLLARRRVDASGADSVSLRELALEADVSHASVYRHFADKRALLAEVATQGFGELIDANRAAIARGGDTPLRRLRACGVAYVEFGRRSPRLLQLMFGPMLAQTPVPPALHEAQAAAYAQLRALVADARSAGELKDAPLDEMVSTCWAFVHGMALLLGERRLPGVADDPRATRALARRCLDHLLAGLAALDATIAHR